MSGVKFLSIFLTAVAALAQDAPPPLPAAVSAESCYLDGRITDRVTGAPVEKAIVSLTVKLNRIDYSAQTLSGSNGHFQFAGLPPGKYRLMGRVKNGPQLAYGALKQDQPGEIITLAPGEARRGLVFPLGRMPTISGHVFDEDGDPIPSAQIMILRDGFIRGKRQMQQTNSDITDDRGEYNIAVLPGRYFVEANDRGMIRFLPGSVVTASRQGKQAPELQFGYGYQYYPGTQRSSEAAPIFLAGQDVRGIDFRLPRLARIRVVGRVTGMPEAVPLSGVHILFQPGDLVGALGQGPGVGVAIQPDRSFVAQDILSGPYVVRLSIAGSDGKQYQAIQHVDLSPASNEINLRLLPTVEVKGVLMVEGEVPAGYRPAQVMLIPGDGAGATGTLKGEVKDDFTFTIPNVPPGVWDVGLRQLPPGGYVKSMTLGGQDVLTEDMVLGSETPLPLKIVISSRGGTVSGRVENAGATQPTIMAVPEGKFRNVVSLYQMARASDDDAKFKLTGLPPGRYRLFAFDIVDINSMQTSEGWKPYEARGELVDVPEGANVTKNLQLIVTAPTGGQ